MPCCRLCGGNGNLRCFCETYLWEGVEERYDQLLNTCFGVRVLPTDGMICERCVRQLRNTQIFRTLVRSVFAKPPRDFRVNQMGIGEGFAHKKIKNKPNLSRLELVKKSSYRLDINPKKPRGERKSMISTNVQLRRMNIACTACKQKYPMIMPFEGSKKFVCSRCKKKGETCSVMPPDMLRSCLGLHAKTDLRGKSRLCSVPKQSSQTVEIKNFAKPKYGGKQCTKKFSSVTQNLTENISNVHNQNTDTTDCVCTISDKVMNTREMLNRHIRVPGQPIYQCDVCMRIFKCKKSFQTHYLIHGK